MKRCILIFIILTLSVVLFAGGKQEKEVGLSSEINILMEAVPDTNFVAQFLPEFESKTGIKVNIETVSYAAMHEKLIPQLIARKSSYDIIVVDKQWVGEFVNAGWIESLDSYIKDDGFDISAYTPSLMNQVGRVNNEVFMLPFYNYSMGLVYRTDIFSDPALQSEFKGKYGREMTIPKTVEEYIETAKFLTREYKGEQLYGIIPQLARGVGNHAEWANLMFALGGDYYDSDWNVTVNKGGALQAAEYLLDIYQNTAPVGSTGYSFDEVFSAVAESRGAMLLTYGWMLAGLNDPAKSQVAGKVDMTVVPGGHGVGGGWGWAIPHNSENKDAAWSFLSWVESFEIAKKRALEGGAPTRFDVFDDPQVMAKYPKLAVMREIVAAGRPMPIMASTNKIVDVMAREISEVTSGKKSVKEAMDAAALMLAEFAEDDPLVQK